MGRITEGLLFTLLGCLISATLFWGLGNNTQPSPKLSNTNNAVPTPTNEPDQTTIKDLQQTIVDLQQQLQWEQDNSIALDYELQLLEDLLEDTQSSNSAPATPRKAKAGEIWFDKERLLALGIPAADIELIKASHNQAELDKLSLRNKTARDPKRRRTLYRDIKTIDTQLRADLGEQNYDRMLFASGKRNRVEVTDVLAGSAADATTIQKGDLIISYGGERIYEAANLYQSTAKGEIGETTLVEVQRGDEIVSVYVPRGPLGTRFRPVSREPQ